MFTGYVIAVAGAVAGLILVALSLWQPSTFAAISQTASSVAAPIGDATNSARLGTIDFFDRINGQLSAGAERNALRDENELARIRLAEAEAIKAENRRLKGMLGISTDPIKPVTLTRFIGSSGSSTRRYGYIGAGSARGVMRGMPVRTERGIVGRVLEVGRYTSRVLLVTDSDSILPVRVAGSDISAFAEGRGDKNLYIKLINLGVNPIKKGDVFVTSGAGGYFRPGIAVAVARQITTDGAIASVLADPSETNYVAVDPIASPEMIRAAELAADVPLPGQSDEANEVSAPAPATGSSASRAANSTSRPSTRTPNQRSQSPRPRPAPATSRPAPRPAATGGALPSPSQPSPLPQVHSGNRPSPPSQPGAAPRANPRPNAPQPSPPVNPAGGPQR